MDKNIVELIEKGIAEIMILSYRRSLGNNDTFVTYSPHVDELEIRMYVGKWDGGKEPVYIRINLDTDQALSNIKHAIQAICTGEIKTSAELVINKEAKPKYNPNELLVENLNTEIGKDKEVPSVN